MKVAAPITKKREDLGSRYYSQNGEDCLLAQFFRHRKSGVFVEVGAFDGIHLSNSYHFEQLGWTGVCIEPLSYYFALCKANRPSSACVHAACVANAAQPHVDLFVEPTGVLSGAQSGREDDTRTRYAHLGLEFTSFTTERAPARTLDAILQATEFGRREIDFVSIDVEGTELSVLQGFDLRRFHPRVLMIEANSEKARALTVDYLQVRGYRFARRLKENLFFVRDGIDLAALRGIHLDCVLEPAVHPHGEEFTPQGLRTRRRVVSEGVVHPLTAKSVAGSLVLRAAGHLGLWALAHWIRTRYWSGRS